MVQCANTGLSSLQQRACGGAEMLTNTFSLLILGGRACYQNCIPDHTGPVSEPLLHYQIRPLAITGTTSHIR